LFLALPVVVGSLSETASQPSSEEEPLLCAVQRGDFVHSVAVRGEVESAVNVEVRCEVRSRSNAWTQILEVVPEGTYVKPGDFLIRLDSSGLEADRLQQLIVCERAEAAVIQAQGVYASAQAADQEYLAGQYSLEREQIQQSLFLAKEKDRRARHYLQYSRQLAARNYITPLQLQSDEFAVKAAESELSLAETRLAVLENFTKPRQLRDLHGKVVTAKARLFALERICRLRQEELARIEEQIAKCEIRAPVAGQVVLAHLQHEGHSHYIQPGEMTLENRVLVRLPDPKRMQIKASITENKIALVRPGAPATIALEAFPEITLQGAVLRVNEYPNPDSWFGSAAKKYETIISLDPASGVSSLDLRPGLTADLNVTVETIPDQLLIPCQATFKHGEKDYCISVDDGQWIAQEVSLGPNNGRFVVVRSGLTEGRPLILDAATYRRKVLPAEAPRDLSRSLCHTPSPLDH
jgi:multidrug efflux pump subunit AcrA (membrane-fusion protein)